ncbi:MAG TPA: hypothetical protein PKY59_13785 [Pyrinomonadaceae bacterium]|nr:hypothetical protein [Pyrinomonadaceae bacterium]
MAESKIIVVSIMSPGVANDGGGWVIINGKLVRIPPRSPKYKELAAALSLLAQTEQLADKRARSQVSVVIEPLVTKNVEAVVAEVTK